jgi:hypothetical protein
LIQIIIAFVGVSGILIPFFYSEIVNNFFDKLFLSFSVYPNKDVYNIIIKNSGSIPINNITLVIKSLENIEYLFDEFSIEKVYLIYPERHLLNINDTVNINTEIAKLYIPKLTNGEGAAVKIHAAFNESPDYLEVFGVYDNGSAYSTSKSQTNNPLLQPFYSKDIILYLAIFYIVYLFLFIPYFAYHSRVSRFQRLIGHMMDDLIAIKNMNISEKEMVLESNVVIDILLGDNTPKDSIMRKFFLLKWIKKLDDELYKFSLSNTLPLSETIRILLNSKDYVLILELCMMIKKRQKTINAAVENSSLDDSLIIEENRKIIEYSSLLLNTIDWNNYKSNLNFIDMLKAIFLTRAAIFVLMITLVFIFALYRLFILFL